MYNIFTLMYFTEKEKRKMKMFNVFKIIFVSVATAFILSGCNEKGKTGTLTDDISCKATEEVETITGVTPEDTHNNDGFVEVDPVGEKCVETVEKDILAENMMPPEEMVLTYVPVEKISLTVYEVKLAPGNKKMPYVTMYPENCTDKGEIWTSSDTSVATVDRYGNISGVSDGSCTVTVRSTDNNDVFATVNVTVKTPPVTVSTECTYINGILVVNKTYALPQSYAPGNDETATVQLQTMFADAKKEGISLWVKSGYRSYIDQRIIYNDYVARDGADAADRYSARPGHSEHQTGLAFDLNSLSPSFADTAEGMWLAQNCHKYGFIIRYPKDKEHITGYMYEPWHVRYLGVENATLVYESGLCLEEYLGITSEYSY